MATTAAARDRFLSLASKTMFVEGPSTSSYLSAQRLRYEVSEGLYKSDLDACTACGTLMVSERTMSQHQKLSKPHDFHGAAHKQRKTQNTKDIVVISVCKVCERVTKKTTKSPEKPVRTLQVERNKTTKVLPTIDQEISIVAKTGKEENKTNSKKRAKARKDREGLQALINKSKQSASSPGLQLMDFMRPG